MILNRDEYRKQVLGCWMGKNIGGTLGAPFEWRRQVNNVTFYTQDSRASRCPTTTWTSSSCGWSPWRSGPGDRRADAGGVLAAYVGPHWAEYGNAKVNMRSGLLPPLLGHVTITLQRQLRRLHPLGNLGLHCARLPADSPRRYAWRTPSSTTATARGRTRAVFSAALESAAFVESDVARLIDIAPLLHSRPSAAWPAR